MEEGIGSAERNAFKQAYVDHKDRLLTLATALTSDVGSGEDIVHDVFAALIKETTRLNHGSNIGAYLSVCVRNRAIDLLRRKKLREDRADDVRARRVETPVDDPFKLVVRDEEAQMLLNGVRQLPILLREVLSLRIWADLSFQEIAGLQQTTKSTAHVRYGQALEKLRLMLSGEKKDV